MSDRTFASTGVMTFASVINDEVLAPQTWPAAGLPPGENTSSVANKMSLVIEQIDVGNKSGGTAQCAWGYRRKLDNGLLVGDATTSAYTDKSVSIQAGATLVGGAGYIAVQAIEKFNSVKLAISATSASSSVTLKYWNGTTFATVPSGAIIQNVDPSSATTQYIIFKAPNSWVPMDPADAHVAAGYGRGKFILLIQVSASVTLTDVSIVKLMDWVETVANGNALSKEPVGEIIIPAGCPIVPYCSTANDANWVQIDFKQS